MVKSYKALGQLEEAIKLQRKCVFYEAPYEKERRRRNEIYLNELIDEYRGGEGEGEGEGVAVSKST